MGNKQFCEKAVEFVERYYLETLNTSLSKDDIYVVWLCKVLQNNKALLSTNLPDGKYFEVTYNGDKQEFYFDSYVKVGNVCLEENR